MTRYGGLAAIYDYLVAGVDFEGWIDYVESILLRFGHWPESVLDLACGTGNTILPFARRGYRVKGLDLAPEMLEFARQKAREQGLEVDFLAEDMRYFRLPRPVDLITCFHDGLNYLLHYDDLVKTFNSVRENLTPKGLFIFDLNAVLWLQKNTSSDVTVVDEPDLTLIWQSCYHNKLSVWEIQLTVFFREGEYYRKIAETHRERGYSVDDVKRALAEAGLECLAAYDAFSFDPAHEGGRRHFYVARRKD